jgi:hypothetical protein
VLVYAHPIALVLIRYARLSVCPVGATLKESSQRYTEVVFDREEDYRRIKIFKNGSELGSAWHVAVLLVMNFEVAI